MSENICPWIHLEHDEDGKVLICGSSWILYSLVVIQQTTSEEKEKKEGMPGFGMAVVVRLTNLVLKFLRQYFPNTTNFSLSERIRDSLDRSPQQIICKTIDRFINGHVGVTVSTTCQGFMSAMVLKYVFEEEPYVSVSASIEEGVDRPERDRDLGKLAAKWISQNLDSNPSEYGGGGHRGRPGGQRRDNDSPYGCGPATLNNSQHTPSNNQSTLAPNNVQEELRVLRDKLQHEASKKSELTEKVKKLQETLEVKKKAIKANQELGRKAAESGKLKEVVKELREEASKEASKNLELTEKVKELQEELEVVKKEATKANQELGTQKEVVEVLHEELLETALDGVDKVKSSQEANQKMKEELAKRMEEIKGLYHELEATNKDARSSKPIFGWKEPELDQYYNTKILLKDGDREHTIDIWCLQQSEPDHLVPHCISYYTLVTSKGMNDITDAFNKFGETLALPRLQSSWAKIWVPDGQVLTPDRLKELLKAFIADHTYEYHRHRAIKELGNTFKPRDLSEDRTYSRLFQRNQYADWLPGDKPILDEDQLKVAFYELQPIRWKDKFEQQNISLCDQTIGQLLGFFLDCERRANKSIKENNHEQASSKNKKRRLMND